VFTFSAPALFSNMSPVEWEDLLELAERLAKERSFLANEQKQLQQLNEKVNTHCFYL
jgi:hypothetical protein